MLVLELLEHDRETYIVPDYMNRYRAWLAFNRLSSRLVFPFGPIFAQFSIVVKSRRLAALSLFKILSLPLWNRKKGGTYREIRDLTCRGNNFFLPGRKMELENGFVHGLRVFR